MADMPQGQGGQGGQGGLMEMVNSLGQGLTQLVNGLQKAGAPKEIVEPFAASLDAFTAGYEALQGGGSERQEASGAGPVEAGGGQAVPAGQNQMRG